MLPDVPTVLDLGYDLFETCGYLCQMSFVMAPSGLDPEVKETLIDMFSGACQSEAFQSFAQERSFSAPATGGAALNATVNECMRAWYTPGIPCFNG